ncbi:MAG: CoA-binding protein [Thaumarchaeota archaeon]|nr:CoA-binding protein [Nitrososphaerota archaeon]
MPAANFLEPFFKPRSVAVVGASRHPGKIGHEILKNIKIAGYAGKVFPINPVAASILDYPCFPRLSSVPESIDLAILVVPAEETPQTMEECANAHIPAAIVITSGFSEIGKRELENKVLEIAKQGGIRVIGPNTFGIFFADSKFNCTFGTQNVLPGKTAFISQSGAIGLALMAWTTEEKYGVSSIVSIGNKADVDDADLVEYFADHENTKSILIYMEGLVNGRKFVEVAKETTKKKPIIIIKAGRSARGAQAASSHTGSMAGEDAIFDVAFKEAGVLRAETMTQAFDWIQAINESPLPHNEDIVIVTNGGGIGVLATDKSEALGLNISDPPEELKAELRPLLPTFGSLRNPIDLTANANDEMYRNVLSILLKSHHVGGVIPLFCETANIDPTLVAEAILDLKLQHPSKPMTAAFIGGKLSRIAYTNMLEKKFAAYPTAERAVDGMYALVAYSRIKKQSDTDSAKLGA